MTHSLKIRPSYFNDILSRKKTFEIRFNDRNYQVNDVLILNEFDYHEDCETGRSVHVLIRYIHSDFGLLSNYLILSFQGFLEVINRKI